MKLRLFVLLGLLAAPGLAQAGEITKARWIPETSEIELTVRHGGGCKKHEWGLTWNEMCLESLPAQCSANLVHLKGQDDFCEAMISTTSRVKWSGHPYDRYDLAIVGPANTKRISIVAKRDQPKPVAGCKYQLPSGKTITLRVGDSRPDLDGCNACTCQKSGHVSCTELACAPRTGCKVGGKSYRSGERFPAPDGCNSCGCSENGHVFCTELACVR